MRRLSAHLWLRHRCEQFPDAVPGQYSGPGRSSVLSTSRPRPLGAAYLAGLACGVWKSVEEIEGFWRADRRFEPRMHAGVREGLFGEWKSVVARCPVEPL